MRQEDAFQALEAAQSYLLEHYGTVEVSLGDFQRHIRGDKSLPLPGGPGVLAAMHSEPQADGTFKGIVIDTEGILLPPIVGRAEC